APRAQVLTVWYGRGTRQPRRRRSGVRRCGEVRDPEPEGLPGFRDRGRESCMVRAEWRALRLGAPDTLSPRPLRVRLRDRHSARTVARSLVNPPGLPPAPVAHFPLPRPARAPSGPGAAAARPGTCTSPASRTA